MHRYFSTPPIFSAPVANIDRENGIIQGVTIARCGPAKGHNGFVDRTFLLQIVENAATKPAGIKARFGHPNMCSQALGTYLGRFKNYSYSGDLVKADLYLDETAKNTPSGDLYSYVLDMAEKNPDMFGASIVFEIGESVFLEEEVDEEKVEKEYFRLKELRATDIVDEPAATDGLFSANTFPGIASQFLDENPEILDLIFSRPDSIVEFLSNYITNSKMNLSDKIMKNLSAFMADFTVQPENDPLIPPPAMQEPVLDALFENLTAKFPETFSSVENLSQERKAELIMFCMTNLTEQILKTVESFDSLNAEHQELRQQLETGLAELDSERSRSEQLAEQLSARPSIPLNVTDPAISLSSNQEKDETGKQILESMPKDMKRKLSNSSKTT
jgi:hypothetical protein